MKMTVWRSVLALPVSPDRDHMRGPVDAPVTLVEYGDYQCPYCGAAHPVVEMVRQRLRDRMRFVFRNFPLVDLHPHAEFAAQAAEAAGAQGKFWEMHDALFENQERLDPPAVAVYAQSIGIDLDRLARDLQSGEPAAKVAEDFMSGVRSGVRGTPSFFINGMRYEGSWDPPDLLEALKHPETVGAEPLAAPTATA